MNILKKSPLSFDKYHGNGNDFIFISYSAFIKSLPLEDLCRFTRHYCDRNKGIGADGVVFYEVAQKISVLIINSDGSVAATCGNALRCLGLALLRAGSWTGDDSIPVHDAHSGKVFATLYSAHFDATQPEQGVIDVGMGKEQVVLQSPLDSKALVDFKLSLAADPIYVALENPHWIFLAPEFAHFSPSDFYAFGEYAQNKLPAFSLQNKNIPLSNIGMLSPGKSPSEWNLTVYERGAGLTLCCGSGATAARIALEHMHTKITSLKEVRFSMPGGVVSILNGETQRILRGPAQWVFAGANL